ncbi:uncharacterized protein LOC142328474 isoform X2 [Lycorma delicatula]|uniref:uncharacterized protein LOC142328474 isoform X2 n=1 Tax=Lycorma delicatula TaxID=130591 RepID=UPI003F51A668
MHKLVVSYIADVNLIKGLFFVSKLNYKVYKRCITMETMSGMNKDKLLNLFRRVILPLPQRDCSQSWRGRLNSKLRRKEDITTKNNDKNGSGFTIGFNGTVKMSTVSSKNSNIDCNPVTERLKPPPVTCNSSKKIKLNKSSADLNNIVINIRRKSQSSEDKPVSPPLSCSTTGSDKNTTKIEGEEPQNKILKPITTEPKRVTLKRSFSQQGTSLQTEVQDKKQRAKITWP